MLAAPYRRGGQRLYDEAALRRLAILVRARELGFSVKDMQILFSDFSDGPPVSERWHELSQAKLAEFDLRIEKILEMQQMLRKMMRCRCEAFDECGGKILSAMCGDAPAQA